MGLRESLLEERDKLNFLIEKALKDLEVAPEGNVIISFGHGQDYFYLSDTQKHEIVYLKKKKEKALIKALCKKRYAMNVLKAAYEQREIIDRFLCRYDFKAVPEAIKAPRLKEYCKPYLELDDKDSDGEFSIVDYELVAQLRDLCSRILG